MSTRIMITSKLNGNVIDIQENSTKPGALLDAFPPKVGQSLNPGSGDLCGQPDMGGPA